MNAIIRPKIGAILICINDDDTHFGDICKILSLTSTDITVKYKSETVTYKLTQIDFCFMFVNGTILEF